MDFADDDIAIAAALTHVGGVAVDHFDADGYVPTGALALGDNYYYLAAVDDGVDSKQVDGLISHSYLFSVFGPKSSWSRLRHFCKLIKLFGGLFTNKVLSHLLISF